MLDKQAIYDAARRSCELELQHLNRAVADARELLSSLEKRRSVVRKGAQLDRLKTEKLIGERTLLTTSLLRATTRYSVAMPAACFEKTIDPQIDPQDALSMWPEIDAMERPASHAEGEA